jgi:hypothetical protein
MYAYFSIINLSIYIMSHRFSRIAGAALLVGTFVLPFGVFAQTAPAGTLPVTAPVTSSGAAMMGGTHQKTARPKTWTGTVTAVSGTVVSFTAANKSSYTVDTSVGTVKLMRRFGANLVDASSIQVGDKISVTGTLGADGVSITAASLRDTSLQLRSGTFVGTVSAVNGTSFTLASKARGNQTVNTTSTTVFKKGTAAAALSDVAANETVTVSGVWDRTNSNVTADKVTIKVATTRITGTVSVVNGTNLTVTDAKNNTYAIDVSKAAFSYKGGRKADISVIAAGDVVAVVGTSVSGSMNVVAKTVRDTSKSLGAIKVTGSVTAISGGTLTVTDAKGTVYTVDATGAAVTYKGGRKGTIAIVQQGDSVTVTSKAVVSGSTSFAAVSVRDSSQTYKKPAAAPVMAPTAPATSQ